MNTAKEIPGYSEELRLTYGLTPDSVVLDAGGYRGDWASEINRRYGCAVRVLEPIKSFYRQIVDRFAGNHRVQVYNFGLGAVPGTADFGIQNDSTGKFAGATERELVRIEGVEDVLREIGSDIDLVKMNIEGSEFDVVEKLLDTGLISRVKNLQVQWHPVVPNAEARWAVIQGRLPQTHHLTFDSGWVWQNWSLNT